MTFHEPEGWSRPVGYANAVSASGRTVFVAGHVGWDPVTLQFSSRDLAVQARQALKNVVAVLAAAHAKPHHITRMTWYVISREAYGIHRAAIGEHYRDIIGRHFPAMSMVVVSGLIEPAAVVEIEVTAVVPGSEN